MTSLYDLTSEYAAVLADVDAADGVLDGDLEARLDAIAGEHAAKVEACLCMARQLDAEAEMMDAEAKRLEARSRARIDSAARLRSYVLASMKATGTKRLVGTRFTASIQANPPAVEITGDVPEAFTVEVPASSRVDRAAIKAVLLGGETLPFAQLTRGERLVVR